MVPTSLNRPTPSMSAKQALGSPYENPVFRGQEDDEDEKDEGKEDTAKPVAKDNTKEKPKN